MVQVKSEKGTPRCPLAPRYPSQKSDPKTSEVTYLRTGLSRSSGEGGWVSETT